jgi:CDP-diacylglycerol--glycerol-3-phosphate 3-phosphatidyltransferase
MRLAYRSGRLLAGLGVRPAAVTLVNLVLCALVPLTARQGPVAPLAGAALVVLSTVADSADGAVAIITNRVTRLGYVYDSVVDRLGEAAWLAALWLLGAPAWLAVLAGAVTWLQEYLRARASAAAMKEIGGVTVAERPTRAIIAAIGLALAGLAELASRELPAGIATLASRELPAGIATLATAAWLLFGLIGLAQLHGAIHEAFRQPSGEPGSD